MRRYHGGPITPSSAALSAWQDAHAMVSWARPDQVELAFEVAAGVALDNGAFSLWTKGATPDWSGYIEWASYWSRHPAFDWCVIPDVIDGSEAENDTLIDTWPLNRVYSVPVWHMHESLSRLDRLVSTFPRVAIGSSGQFRIVGSAGWWKRIHEAMLVACDPNGFPRVKLHGLRQLDPTITSHIPYSSADSCNVARNIGLDTKWDKGAFRVKSKPLRALIMRSRIGTHATASRYNRTAGVRQNEELIG